MEKCFLVQREREKERESRFRDGPCRICVLYYVDMCNSQYYPRKPLYSGKDAGIQNGLKGPSGEIKHDKKVRRD